MRFEIVQGDQKLTSHAGLVLVGTALSHSRLRERVDKVALLHFRGPKIPGGDLITTMIGLISLGKPDFDAVEPFRNDPFFREALGVAAVPSSPTLRQRLDQVEGRFDRILREESARLVAQLAPKVTPCRGKLVALDIDVSPWDNSGSRKEGVEFTYKGFCGYAPMFAYLGEEGYLANAQLRPGSMHCQRGAPEFIRHSIGYARMMTNAPLLVRMDGGTTAWRTSRSVRKRRWTG